MDKKSLDIIVEEFFDTGKLVLREDIESDVNNEDVGVESEEEIGLHDDENISQEEINYINTEYGSLRNRKDIKNILKNPPFNFRSVDDSKINKYVVRYIVSKEGNKDNKDVFTKEGFVDFLKKVNSVLGTNYENIRTFNELTSIRKPKKEGDLNELEILINLFNMSKESILKWMDIKEKNQQGSQLKPLGPKTIKDRVNKLKNYLSTTNVWEIKETINDLLRKFDLYRVKNFELGEIIDYFKGNPRKEFYLNFISRGFQSGHNYWKIFVKNSKAIKEIVENDKLPEGEHFTTGKNYKKLKEIFEKIKTKEYCYIFSENCELSSSDIEKVKDFFEKTDYIVSHNIYEKSFCCNNNEYFKNCSGKDGDQSLLLKRGDNFKTMTDLIESTSGTTVCAKILYNKIISDSDRIIDKYDIISNNLVTLTNNVVIPNGKNIEVKSYGTGEGGNTLSEFISIYKDKRNRKTYKSEKPLYYQRYNEIVEEVVRLLNENDAGIKDSFLGEDKLFGVFLKDYTFYHYKNMKLEWSTISEQKRFTDEKRITVRFTVDGEGHKWVEGNCNLNQPNPIEESITNFFDTGNFEF